MSGSVQLRLISPSPTGRAELLSQHGDTPLAAALERGTYLLFEPLPAEWASLPLRSFSCAFVGLADIPPGQPLYLPRVAGPVEPEDPTPTSADHPRKISEEEATQLAYAVEARAAASLLRAEQSVLVVCDKIVVPHLAEYIVRMADNEPRVLEAAPAAPDDAGPDQMPAPATTLRQRLLGQLRDMIRELKDDQVLVIPHLDLLGTGQDAALPNEARELIELLYGAADRMVLAFADPSLPIPEVLGARFTARIAIEGTPRMVLRRDDGRPLPAQHALITREEANRFRGLDDTDVYKYLAGLNPVRLRQAMRYASQEHAGRPGVTVDDLRDTIRTFKAQQSSSFEIPDVDWADIGGYVDVKEQIERALLIMEQSLQLPETDKHLRGELAPKGFIFHGPPGTGKTLFAKAIANKFRATIQIVSGPEVTNKYVGESERRIRELFAEARRNAPAVIVFDEFDAIAQRRSGWDDGGSRAGNAMVAQILTEMDGFRPDVQMLVIGTTNKLDMIDEALLRPSRFTSFHIGLPDEAARREIIRVHARRYRISVDGLLEPLILATNGWNGDEIRALFRDAYVGERYENLPAGPERLGQLVGHHQLARKLQQLSRRGRT
jgi:hypothetical protein